MNIRKYMFLLPFLMLFILEPAPKLGESLMKTFVPPIIDTSASQTVTIYGDPADGEVINQWCSDWSNCRSSPSGNTLFQGIIRGSVAAAYEPTSYYGPYLVLQRNIG